MSGERRQTRAALAVSVLATTIGAAFVLPGSATAGLTAVISLYENEAVAIPNGHGAAKMPLAMSNSSRMVGSVSANFRVRHDRTQQLKLLLKGPNGVKVLLSDGETRGENLGEGHCGDDPDAVDFTGFRASGPGQLADSSAPYVGYFFPNESLSGLTGIPPEGDWTLIVKDTRSQGDAGKLLCGLVVLSLPPP